MQYIVLKDIKISKTSNGYNRIEYEYDVPEVMKQYIKKNQKFYVELPMDCSDIPKPILTIPFTGVMLTVSMLLNIGIKVEQIDKKFYENIKMLESKFNEKYVTSNLKLLVDASEIKECSYVRSDKVSLFFTGGVDATSALVKTYEEKPVLINIWGGDLRLTDNDSHIELERYLTDFTSKLGLEYYFIKTNCREMFEENELGFLCNNFLKRKDNHGWWASIAHILCMCSVLAPWAYANKIKMHYIGSSYDSNIKTFDANSKEFVENISYSSCEFEIVDEKIERNEKVKNIIKFQKKVQVPIELKVCWNRTAGINCSGCEKCYRTILNIISQHGDPNDYGFTVDKKVLQEMRKFLQENTVSEAFWIPIQQAFISDRKYWSDKEEINWILDIKLNSIKVYIKKIKRRLIGKR